MKVTIAIVPPEEEQSVQLSIHNIDDELKRIIAQLQSIDSNDANVRSAENNTEINTSDKLLSLIHISEPTRHRP